MSLDDFPAFSALPLVAIFRGVEPDEAMQMAGVVIEAGFSVVEVPLNSPQPIESIRRIAEGYPDALVGAGTVMTPSDVEEVAGAGGRLVVMPHCDPAVIGAAKAKDMICIPGVATPTEAFAALAMGADGLKMFPAEAMPPTVVKAWRAVVPATIPLLPVGGISPSTMASYRAAGATGFGLGSALYRAGMSVQEVAKNARAFVEAWHGPTS